MPDERLDPVLVHAGESAVFHRELDRGYPLIERGEGIWLIDTDGNRYLDAVGGGAMVASLGAGAADVIEAARAQLEKIGFLYNQQFTSLAQELLARRLVALAPGFARVHFTSGGAEANETMLRLARAYHVERGEPDRWNVISFAQAYHGPTMATLALTGRPGLQRPNQPYLPGFVHVSPPTRRFDATGERTWSRSRPRSPSTAPARSQPSSASRCQRPRCPPSGHRTPSGAASTSSAASTASSSALTRW
jgi:adenosylmethionine-8-amino-7-oxononanoate aminotransferase